MRTVSSKSQLHESYSSGWEWANLQRLPKICAGDVISDILKMITELSAIPPFQLDPRDSKISHDSKKTTPFFGVENSDFSDVKSSVLDSEQTGFLDDSNKASKRPLA
ncbi:hypothetical protein AYI69_g8416 [Smittium culicis]|uniref:Uncharacterized protein n=1 Tax=Smittium culicis TaxID=133412 RepID=A0A1R1XJT7_9FUNG|nr:hypothetical protein AYI69_g8416 [Smittium culicis]